METLKLIEDMAIAIKKKDALIRCLQDAVAMANETLDFADAEVKRALEREEEYKKELQAQAEIIIMLMGKKEIGVELLAKYNASKTEIKMLERWWMK